MKSLNERHNMKTKRIEFREQLETLANEIEQLNYEEIEGWIEENIVEISNNYNELIITVGGPSIKLYIDSGVIRGQKGFSSKPIFIECNTSELEEYFYDFK